jgi:hypothetical protein
LCRVTRKRYLHYYILNISFRKQADRQIVLAAFSDRQLPRSKAGRHCCTHPKVNLQVAPEVGLQSQRSTLQQATRTFGTDGHTVGRGAVQKKASQDASSKRRNANRRRFTDGSSARGIRYGRGPPVFVVVAGSRPPFDNDACCWDEAAWIIRLQRHHQPYTIKFMISLLRGRQCVEAADRDLNFVLLEKRWVVARQTNMLRSVPSETDPCVHILDPRLRRHLHHPHGHHHQHDMASCITASSPARL